MNCYGILQTQIIKMNNQKLELWNFFADILKPPDVSL